MDITNEPDPNLISDVDETIAAFEEREEKEKEKAAAAATGSGPERIRSAKNADFCLSWPKQMKNEVALCMHRKAH